MKKIISWILVCAVITGCFVVHRDTVWAEENGQGVGSLYATSAVLMDADSGRILYEKNGFEKRPMASTTKIMTCILALEKGNAEDIVAWMPLSQWGRNRRCIPQQRQTWHVS